MNVARLAGALPARPFSIQSDVSRTALFAAAGVLAALNAEADQIISAVQYERVGLVIGTLAGVSAVVWFAMYAALTIGFEAPVGRLRRGDALVLSAILVLAVVPLLYAAKAALLLAALHLFFTPQPGHSDRRVACVLLALTGPLIWGRLILLALASPLLSLDAHIVGRLIGSPVDGNTVQFSGSRIQFLVGTGCSSLHNMSLAIVLWTTAIALFNLRLSWRLLVIGVAMVLWMFVLNILRLASIGLFPARFVFLHEGAGAELFGWGSLLGAAALIAFGVIDASRRQQ